jgi:excisionase family DNA binding protein
MEKLAYTRRESADLLSISLRTLDSLLSRKELRFTRIGRRVLITREDLERVLRHRGTRIVERHP